ncbi:class I SAM-dependent methyltransferase [Crossiella sp. SN42]|uniref:class I SAM-dependent methyltransferase n=1 Tax=Crossiella sp. SN42 TaxID=2944808 RepID=UPI00207C53E8|nr:class I SAM-dependent methyltransferase [Crossiella sp. SN42]MCO1580326.1 class I SAM-dependent methyltransferase [Crossiella sp. SN42]
MSVVLAETMARAGQGLLGTTPPNGRAYWSARFWDRDKAERHPVLAPEFLRQRETIARYLREYGGQAATSLEFGCGTGEFTRLTALGTPVAEMTALDISAQAIEIARGKVEHANIEFVRGDFWAEHGLAPADLVVCVDAIHHLGDVRAVLRRLRSFVKPGGVFIGNLFTLDNFHEFERLRYGALEHLWRTTMFLGSAVLIRASGGRLRSGSHRTQLLPSAQGQRLLAEEFGEVLEVSADPYFTAFACRG